MSLQQPRWILPLQLPRTVSAGAGRQRVPMGKSLHHPRSWWEDTSFFACCGGHSILSHPSSSGHRHLLDLAVGALWFWVAELSSGHGSECGCTKDYGDHLRTSTSGIAQQEGWCNLMWAECTDKLMTGKMPTRRKSGATWTSDWLIKCLLKASLVDTLGSDWIYSKSSRELHFLWKWFYYDPWITSSRCRKAFRLLPLSIIFIRHV